MNLLFLALLIAQPEPPDYSGIYEVKGVQILGAERKTYSSLAILKRIPDTDKYVAQWTGGVGNNITGIGYLSGKKLIFSWKSEDLIGMSEYTLGDKGVHKGIWFTNKGINVWHVETITFRMPWVPPYVEEAPVNEEAKTSSDRRTTDKRRVLQQGM